MLTARENFICFLKRETYEWVPNSDDQLRFSMMFTTWKTGRNLSVFPTLTVWTGRAVPGKTGNICRRTSWSPTPFFERLISFVGFEDAAVALVDEDLQEPVHSLLERLAEYYAEFIRRMHRHFNVK